MKHDITALETALAYLSYCVHEGVLEPEDFSGKSNDEIIDMATSMMDQADAAWNAYKEEHEN